MRSPRLFLFLLLGVFLAFQATAADEAFAVDKTLCIFDPSGASGDIFNGMKNYQVEAAAWGVNFELKPYTNEATAVSDFKSGKCNAALLTGTRVRSFNKFSGSIEAIGAIPTYKHLKKIVRLMAKEKMAKLAKAGEYEVGGIFPAGAVYLLVRDKKINSMAALSGKSIATFDFDDAAKVMVKVAGASASPASIGTFAGMFNGGSVDACYAPAAAFVPLELYKGLKDGGGIIRYPIAQTTMQIVFRSADFPETFGVQSRKFSGDNFSKQVKAVKKAERDVPSKYWIDISDEDKASYDKIFLETRLELRDKHKVYHKTMLTLLRKIRCKIDTERGECADQRE